MKKNTLTIRSVTFAAVAGLSLGIAAPAAIAQDTAINQAAGDSPLVNKNAKGALTIHKFGNPINEGTPSGTLEDAKDVERNGGEALDGVGFTVYKINKTADGLPTSMSPRMRGSSLPPSSRLQTSPRGRSSRMACRLGSSPRSLLARPVKTAPGR